MGSKEVRCYSPAQVLEKDVLVALERVNTQYKPFSACIESEQGSAIVTVNEFYEGHLPIDQVRAIYDYPVKVEYFTGEYGEKENRPLTRVYWSGVEPIKIIDVV